MRSLRIFTWIAVVPALLGGATASAQVAVPESLEPWRDWVLYGEEYRACPVLNGRQGDQAASHVCAWPGELRVDVTAGGADFEIDWTVHAQAWVPLPGDAAYWPTGVTVDGATMPVVQRTNRPMLRLQAGEHRVTGSIAWATRPASIRVPPEVGLVALTLDGTGVANAELEGDTLWLGLRPDDVVEEDRLDVVVYRRLEDALPMLVETVVDLDVAGQSREVVLDGALLDGFVGEALESDLPAELDQDGTLRAQVRPGRWRLSLAAHATTLPASIALAGATEPWPADEIWSFESVPRLRVAAVEGVPAIDSRQSGVPPEWRDFPSYAVSAGQTVTIVERSRNDAAEPNRLSLRRDLWLDFDGGGFTARDAVSGEMRSGWRVDMAAPYTMTMASIGEENLLVTEGLEPAEQGVELRASSVDLTDTSRVARGGSVPVSGYSQTVDSVVTTLHVPPGYRLLAAPGANAATGAWFDAWRLIDIFLVLIIVVSTWRMFGTVAGLVAIAALALTFHEPWAPRWAWLNLLLAIALVRVAPVGRLQSFCRRYRFVSLAALAVLLIPFATLELRAVVFPQLERPILQRGLASVPGGGLLNLARSRVAADAVRAAVPPEPQLGALEEVVVTGSRIERGVSRYLPGALVQTGPGLPDWAWTRYTLQFSGPIDPGQSYRMLMLGPWSLAAWRIASVAFALALAWLLLRSGTATPALARKKGAGPGVAAVLLAGVAATLLSGQSRAQALSEFPSPALLEELKQRLLTPQPCHPVCGELTRATVELDDVNLTVSLEYAAQDTVAVPVPTSPGSWRPQAIAVDGVAVGFLFRDAAEQSWLTLDEGVHGVTLTGPVPPTNSLVLPFPLPPRRIEVSAPGWDVAGVAEGRLPSGALELIRQQQQGQDGEALSGTVFPPYVRVTRRLVFDLDWSVETVVQRVAPADGAFTLNIGLLPNEAVVTPGIDVNDGAASAAFMAGQQFVRWESALPTANSIELTAAIGVPWSESWVFNVGQIWHAQYAGVPATPPVSRDASFYTPEYFPRPGETLTVDLQRPEPATGDTIAIDSVEYERTVGARVAESTLHFEYRSTRGSERVISLPEGSELGSVEHDGQQIPLRLDGNSIGIPITPGEHNVEIRWRDGNGIATLATMPAVDFGVGASNIQTSIRLPQDRWVLFAYGPTLGPAILYWPELLVFALVAFVLGRLQLSPLRTHEWLLLGFGLSTFAWPVLFLFAVWAFVLSWRGSTELGLARAWYNAVQGGLGLLTVVAIVALVAAIPVGLLGEADMQIVSPVEYGALGWFADRTAGTTPASGVISVSPWFYRAAMLAWSLWLSFALLRWLPWAWRAFSRGGYWRGKVEQRAT